MASSCPEDLSGPRTGVPWEGTLAPGPSSEVRGFRGNGWVERDELENYEGFHWTRNLSLQNRSHGKLWLHCCGHTSLSSQGRHSTGPRTHTTRSAKIPEAPPV